MFSRYTSLAGRVTYGKSFGPNPQKFILGGLQNWIYGSGETSGVKDESRFRSQPIDTSNTSMLIDPVIPSNVASSVVFPSDIAFILFTLSISRISEEDFSETLALIYKYKAVENTFKKAEYFVNVSYDALAIFPDSEDKRILQSLTSFSLNRSY